MYQNGWPSHKNKAVSWRVCGDDSGSGSGSGSGGDSGERKNGDESVNMYCEANAKIENERER